jgi:hypothetical protein
MWGRRSSSCGVICIRATRHIENFRSSRPEYVRALRPLAALARRARLRRSRCDRCSAFPMMASISDWAALEDGFPLDHLARPQAAVRTEVVETAAGHGRRKGLSGGRGVSYARAMAIIKCLACGREISDAMGACPGCGLPLATASIPAPLLSPVVTRSPVVVRPTIRTLRQDRSVVWTIGAATVLVVASAFVEWCRSPH